MSLPDLNTVITGLRDIETTRFAQLASSTIIVFDHLITLDEEINFIWGSSWSIGKTLFIINRYYTLASVALNTYGFFSPNLTNSVRLLFFHWQGWTGLVSCSIAQIILQMRIYAMYFLNKRILAVMVALFVCALTTASVIMGRVLQGIHAIAHPLPGTSFTFCTPLGIPRYFFVFWVPLICFEVLLCAMALYRGLQTFRIHGPNSTLYQSGRHLVSILVRDSVLYFLVMFATYFTSLLIWLIARPSLLEVPVSFSVAFSCTLCNRIILNVRQVKSGMDEASAVERARARKRRPARLRELDAYSQPRSPPRAAAPHGSQSHPDTEDTCPEDKWDSACGASRKVHDPESPTYPPSATLSEAEMARLRSMRVDSGYIRGLESQTEAYEYERGCGAYVVL
ncbi:hypothetical protein MKEN_00155400 [Mycena kentingensis (nom. inval.)]|nr:hypothetical protein MKEN_00155400 [Mycena kentingensis (nom. inval.)]